MFGIEIRKVGSAKSLYEDVDRVLKNYNIPKGSVSQDLQVSTVAHSLHKMIQVESYFNICTVDHCVKICQIIIPAERYKVYHAIHCMHWNEMLPDYRQTIVAMILDDFRTILNPDSENLDLETKKK